MAISLSDVSGALKKVLLPYIRDNFPKQTILLDQVKRNSGTNFINDTFYIPLRTSRNAGVVNLASDTSKLRNGAANIGQASSPVRTATGAFEISKLAIAATNSQKGSVEPMLRFQADSLMTDFSRSVNRQFMGDGSGVISKINGAGTAAGTAISVTSVNPVNGDIGAVKYMSPGGVYMFGTALGTVSSVIQNSVGSTGTVNLTSSITPGGTGASITNVDGDGVASAEFNGIDLFIGTGGTLQGLARATTPQWEGNLGTLAGGTLTLNGMTQKHLQASQYAMAGDRYALFANQTPFNAYGNILVSYRRDVNTRELIGGWTGLEFAVGQKPTGMFIDYDTTEGRVMGVDLDSLTVGEVQPMDWESDPNSGQPLLRRIDYLTYQAVMYYFAQFIALGPAANWKLTGIVG